MELHRGFRVLAALVLSTGVLSVISVGGRSVPSTAATVASCNLQRFAASSSITSRPGGTTVRVVMLSHVFPTCQWSSATRYQFLNTQSQPIGNAVVYPSARNTSVNATFQVVQNISTTEGVLCTSKVAAYLAVIGPRSRRVVRLASTIGVCVGGTTKWTTVDSLSFPVADKCARSSLRLGIGQSEGAAGTIYYPLVFTNIGGIACTISGIPRVQPSTGTSSNSTHVPVGPKAALRDFSASGYGQSIRLAPRAQASAAYGVAQSANYPRSRCEPANFAGVTVQLAGIGQWWTSLSSSTCTKVVSTFVTGVVPTTTGAPPL
ncbi:MAG: DUF4232 domain-containing protein [Acidimicrobiales bacterium]